MLLLMRDSSAERSTSHWTKLVCTSKIRFGSKPCAEMMAGLPVAEWRGGSAFVHGTFQGYRDAHIGVQGIKQVLVDLVHDVAKHLNIVPA